MTKEGTIIYCVGDSTIHDGGKLLDVLCYVDDDGFYAALLMAKHCYEKNLTVNGSFEFKK